jgi:hypothetical protein
LIGRDLQLRFQFGHAVLVALGHALAHFSRILFHVITAFASGVMGGGIAGSRRWRRLRQSHRARSGKQRRQKQTMRCACHLDFLSKP